MTRQTIRIAAELEKVTERIISSLAVNITAELIERTPVDIGWARANWVPAIGRQPELQADELPEDARRAFVSGQTAQQAAATAALLTYQIERGPVFISNGVPYISILNGGSSSQAPAGFVQQAIVAGVRSLDSRNFA